MIEVPLSFMGSFHSGNWIIMVVFKGNSENSKSHHFNMQFFMTLEEYFFRTDLLGGAEIRAASLAGCERLIGSK